MISHSDITTRHTFLGFHLLDNHLTIRASLAHRNTLFFYPIFAQGQKVKYTNPNYHTTIQKLQEVEEIAR